MIEIPLALQHRELDLFEAIKMHGRRLGSPPFHLRLMRCAHGHGLCVTTMVCYYRQEMEHHANGVRRIHGNREDQRKPVATICHASWTLIHAGAARSRRLASYPSLSSDLTAGAQWVDEPCVIDNGLVTSRGPDDLAVFNERMLEVFRRSG